MSHCCRQDCLRVFGLNLQSTNQFLVRLSYVLETAVLRQDGACLSLTPSGSECGAKKLRSQGKIFFFLAQKPKNRESVLPMVSTHFRWKFYVVKRGWLITFSVDDATVSPSTMSEMSEQKGMHSQWALYCEVVVVWITRYWTPFDQYKVNFMNDFFCARLWYLKNEVSLLLPVGCNLQKRETAPDFGIASTRIFFFFPSFRNCSRFAKDVLEMGTPKETLFS